MWTLFQKCQTVSSSSRHQAAAAAQRQEQRHEKEEASSLDNIDMVLLAELHGFLRDRTKIGLERMAAKEINQDKHRRWRMLLEIVQEIQMREFACQATKTRLLRVACQEISHSSVLFALYLGWAATKVVTKTWNRYAWTCQSTIQQPMDGILNFLPTFIPLCV
jgi:hypothetical protein